MASPAISLASDAHLLVPIDFSNHSREALHAAVEMLKLGQGGQLTLLNVVEPPTRGLRIQTDDLHKQMALDAEQELRQWIKAEIPDLERVTPVVTTGSPGDEVCEQAAKRRVSLIVISTHGHTGLKRYLLGSVAEKVVRHAPCSVLIVR
jgi:universal stress protein A